EGRLVLRRRASSRPEKAPDGERQRDRNTLLPVETDAVLCPWSIRKRTIANRLPRRQALIRRRKGQEGHHESVPVQSGAAVSQSLSPKNTILWFDRCRQIACRPRRMSRTA